MGDQTRILGKFGETRISRFPRIGELWQGKVLTEAAKVVETGSQGGVKGVKVLSLFYNLLLDVL